MRDRQTDTERERLSDSLTQEEKERGREVFKNLRVAQKINRSHPIQIAFQIDPFIKLNIIKTERNTECKKNIRSNE